MPRIHAPFLSRLASSSALLVLAACASQPAPPPQAPEAPKPAAAPPPPPADLTAVPEPEGLVVFARLAKPSAALQVLGGWAHTPMPGADQIGALLSGVPTGDAIDLDQPIDFAMVLKGTKTRGAISAALRSMDAARAAFAKYKLTPADNGAFTVDGLGKGGDADGDDPDARACEVAPAFGAASARLVCADTDEALKLLGPWLTRSATRATYPSDFHADARLAPVRPLVAQSRRILPLLVGGAMGVHKTKNPGLDDALRATLDDFADFTSDADTLALDAMLADAQANVTLTTTFRSTSSVLARVAVAHPERADAPPAAFWKLPADTDAAYFHRGMDAADFAPLRDHLTAIFSGLLNDKENAPPLSDKDRAALRDMLAHTFDLFSMPSVYGKGGGDEAAAQKAVAAIDGAKEGAPHEEAERVAAEAFAGWAAMEVDEPAAKVGATLKEWATVMSRPGVVKWLPGNEKLVQPPVVFKTAPPPAGVAAKDAVHLEVVSYREHPIEKGKKTPPPAKAMTLHVLVVPDGASSWIVTAADEKLLVQKTKDILAGTSALASRPGLTAMKSAKVNAAGFFTARGLANGTPFAWALGDYWGDLHDGDLKTLDAAADQGMTPFTLAFTSQAGGGSAPAGSVVATATLPKATVEGLARTLLH